MNTKNNRKRKASTEKIEQTFITLIQDTPMERISVSHICELAGLNRTTFYANYEDVYDLGHKVYEKLKSETDTLMAETAQDTDLAEHFTILFAHMKEHQMIYRTIFKMGYHKVAPVFTDHRLIAADDPYQEMHMEFFRAGYNRLAELWLSQGCKESPEEMANVIITAWVSQKR